MNQGDVISAFLQQAHGSSVSFVNPSRSRWTSVFGPSAPLHDEAAHHICIEHSAPVISVSTELVKSLPEGVAVPSGPGAHGRFTHQISLEQPPRACETPETLVATLVNAATRARVW